MTNENLKKNFVWNTIGVFTMSLTSFVYSLIIVRVCNIAMSGIWSYAFAIACTCVTLASFGGRTYQVTDAKDELPTYTYVSARYITVSAMIVIMLLFILIKDFSFYKALIVFALCLFKFCEELSDVYYGILQKHEKLYIVGKSMFYKSIINMILFLIGLYITKDLIVPILIILLNNFLFIFLYDRRNALKEEKIKKIIQKDFYLQYFKSNLIICLILFLSMYLVNCPKYAMQMYLSDELQGIYNILYLPAIAISLIGSFIINPLLVGMSKQYAQGEIKVIKQSSYKICIILLLFGFVACILGFLLGRPVINLFFNFDITSYMIPFILTIVGCTFYTISTILSMILITARKLISQLIFNILLAIISFTLCVYMVINYGLKGGIYAYAIVMFIRFFVYLIMIKLLNNSKIKIVKEI